MLSNFQAALVDRKNIFDMFDHDSNGKITVKEIVLTFNELCLPISVEQANMLVAEFDKNSNGELEFTEFISMVKKYMTMEDYPVEGMFRYFDMDGDGFITVKEFINSLRYLGIIVTEEDVQPMVDEYCTSDGDQMNYQEFVLMMQHYF